MAATSGSLTLLVHQTLKNFQMISKKNWKGIKELKIDESEALRPPKGTKLKPIIYGAKWKGSPPEFKSLRWM